VKLKLKSIQNIGKIVFFANRSEEKLNEGSRTGETFDNVKKMKKLLKEIQQNLPNCL